MAFKIYFSPLIREHLKSLSAREQGILLDQIDEQLQHEPGMPTRNRKSLFNNCSQPASARALAKHSARADAGWERVK